LNARAGKGEIMIAECDESDGSFLLLRPAIAVITNIDREHLDHYDGFEGVRAAFAEFAARAGCVVACCDDAEVRSAVAGASGGVLTYGRSGDAMFRIEDESYGPSASEFSLHGPGGLEGRFRINAPGAHNVLNATAAIAVALELGVSPEAANAALAGYSGAGRRMEFKGEDGGIAVIDDYGHHPTEVRATIEALRLRRPARLYVLFQPHRYTRTRDLMDEFSQAFAAADCVRVLDIYAASEAPIPGVSGAELAARIRAAGHPDCLYAGPLDGAVAESLVELKPGDLVLTLGAGSVTEAGPRILAELRKERP
jgi:UDP-N-acetylmuramate--alanine ligase